MYYFGVDAVKQATLNFIVDLIGFCNLLGLAITGCIMKWILLPGSAGQGRGFRGGRGATEIKYLWSMTRHEWGAIHFYLAVLFVSLMIAYVVLHWTWIKCCLKSLLGFSRKAS